MKDQQKRHKLALNFAVSTWKISWSLADCLVTKRWHWNEGCLCYHIFSLCWSASDSTIYWIKPAKYGIKVFTITDLTIYSFNTVHFIVMLYKKESYGCVNDPKLWRHWIRNWERRSEGGGGRPWIKSCYNHKKDGIDVWYQICVAYNQISYTGFPIVF
jgi:hypothetical protein